MYAVEWSQGIEDAWTNVAEFVPKLIAFALILFIGWVLARALGKLFNEVLERVGFDDAVERGGVRRALEKSKYDASDLLGKVVYYALFLLVLQAAFGVFGENPISDLIDSVIAYLPKVFVAIVIVVIASAVAAGVKELVQNSLSGLSYGRTLATAASTMIVVVGIFAALNQLEIAPAIVNGLFYAILAIVVGSAVIAIGGAGVTEMRPYVRRALEKVDDEAGKVKAEAQKNKASDAEQQSSRARPLTADDAVATGGHGPYDRPTS